LKQINSLTFHKNNNFTYKELGVFLLLLLLNIKLTTIVITHNRNIFIDLAVYILLIITFNYSNWTYKQLLKSAIIIGVYTLINFSQYKLNVLMPLLIMQSVSGISFTKYLKINFVISSFFLIIMYIVYGEGTNMSGFGFIIERKTRMSFGFNAPNVAALHYFCLIVNGLLLLYFSKYKKYVTYYFLLITPLWFYIYSSTASRSFLLSIVILYGMYGYIYISQRINKKSNFRIVSYFYISLIYLFPILTLFFSIYYDTFPILNHLLSNRLKFYNWFLKTLNLNDFMFGSNTFGNFVIDSSYLHLLFEGGVIFFLFIGYFYVLATIKMVNKRAWLPICVVFSFMAYGLMESMLLYSMLIGTNIYWITLYYFYSNGKMKL
jgi:hypothetical protein